MIRAAIATLALAAGSLSASPGDGMEFEDSGRDCLALAVYTEARGEPLQGQIAVVEVIRNRMEASEWPAFPCDVVGELHQFHGFRDWPRPSYPWDEDRDAWERALRVVDGVMLEGWESGCADATHFWAGARPSWARGMTIHCHIGRHRFASP